MKNKLHKNNILCHSEQSEGSRNTTNHVTSSSKAYREVKFSNLYILLCSIPATAQNYQWQWALNGGGSFGSGSWDYQVEQIFDIAIDKNNNYYFVAKIKGVAAFIFEVVEVDTTNVLLCTQGSNKCVHRNLKNTTYYDCRVAYVAKDDFRVFSPFIRCFVL
ncbi:hypothetical protein H1R17_01440 [Flavobacterium sp. xlx-214]|uniref:hypothetical protein n=1 Tax=unclassified Flavobacterium TaxID=196869 RepID=UPI0013D0BB80|nr:MULTISPECIES: hypothetical protein [unclassified Flavobacterium]MBA5792684.1 hypothetical protein [Flavobacterium sp. xlx-221]QMI83829.1 hypothetical protein H1R17_01440 [Flavobacterium sp. xlx-214]